MVNPRSRLQWLRRLLPGTRQITASRSSPDNSDRQVRRSLRMWSLWSQPILASATLTLTSGLGESLAASPDIQWLQGFTAANRLSASTDGRLLVSAWEGFPTSLIQLWSVPERRLLRTLPEASSDSQFPTALSPDGKWVASSVGDRLTLWDAETGSILRRWNTPGTNATALAFDATGKQLASGSLNGGVQLWTVATGELAQTWKPNDSEVLDLSFLSTTSEWIRASLNNRHRGALEGWKPGTDAVRTLRSEIQSLEGFTIAPAGDRIVTWASANPNEQIVVINSGDGSVVKKFTWHTFYEPKHVIFYKGSSEVVGIGEFPPVTRFPIDGPPLSGFQESPWSIQNGTRLVSLGTNADTFVAAARNLYLVDESTKGIPPKLNSVNDRYGPLHFSPDSQTVWVTALLAPLKVTDGTVSGTPLAYAGLDDFDVSPDGSYVAVAAASALTLQDAVSREFIRHLNPPTAVSKVRFSPDSRLLLVGLSDGNVQLRGIPDGSLIRTLKLATTPRTALAFTPDGRHWAAGQESGGVRIVRVDDGSTERSLEGPGVVRLLEYSPDGTMLAGLGLDGTISVWRGNSTNVSYRLSVPNQSAMNIKFSPDSSVLAATYHDLGKIHFWRTRDARPVLEWNVETQTAAEIDFSPDNRWIGYRRTDGTVVLATNPFGLLATRPDLEIQPQPGDRLRVHLTQLPPGQLQHLERSQNLSTWEIIEDLDAPPSELSRDYPSEGAQWYFRTRRD